MALCGTVPGDAVAAAGAAAKGLAEAVAGALGAQGGAPEQEAAAAAARALDLADRCLRAGSPAFLSALSREASFFSALSAWLRRRASGGASPSGRPPPASPAAQRGLQLSREWADLFTPQREELPEFQQLYRDVRREVPGFPGELCWGSAAADDLKKLKGLKENLAMLRELHEANKKTVSQAGRAFRVHATLNGGLTQSLCAQCSQTRAFLAETLERADPGGASPAELLTLLDEIDDLLPKLGWRDGIPQRSKGARRRSVTCAAPSALKPRKRLSSFWLEDSDISEAMLDQHIAAAEASGELSLWEEPRPGKALLVLDLDYTLADFTPFTQPDGTFDLEDPEAIKRPRVESFLAGAYRDWDLCVWSRTSPEALETKLDLLGWLDHPDFCWTLVLDRTHMIEVSVGARGAPSAISSPVKPLRLIWDSEETQGAYGPANTLHVDDTPLNFLLNPRNGVTCSVWEAPDEDTFQSEGFEDPDEELRMLGLYLNEALRRGPLDEQDNEGWERLGEKLLREEEQDAAGKGAEVGAGAGAGPGGGGPAPGH